MPRGVRPFVLRAACVVLSQSTTGLCAIVKSRLDWPQQHFQQGYRMTKRFGMLGASFAALLGAAFVTPAVAQVQIDADDIGGVVTGAKGPEAGVWVIAETKDLPTR